MQIEDLAMIVLDPNLGCPWPELIDRRPKWDVGRKWRVEYSFSSPAIPLSALALGTEVRAVWRYEVIARDKQEDGTETVTLRVSPERRGAAGYHFVARYRANDLLLLDVKRFEGDLELPFKLRKLPPLDQGVTRSEDGRTFVRTFEMKPPPKPVEVEAIEEYFEGAEEVLEQEET